MLIAMKPAANSAMSSAMNLEDLAAFALLALLWVGIAGSAFVLYRWLFAGDFSDDRFHLGL